VPRPEQPLRIWLGTGGSPNSVLRAVELGLPMFLGILGGTPEYWAQYGHAYHQAWAQVGHPAEAADIAVAVHGSSPTTTARPKPPTWSTRRHVPNRPGRGRPPRSPPSDRAASYGPGGMVFVGGPNQVADRILGLHELLGHSHQILQMDVGAMPQATFLKGIELLGTKVLPQIRKELHQP